MMKAPRLAVTQGRLVHAVAGVHSGECGFLSLRESWCDTTNKFGRLLVTIMGGLNQFERELIAERCEEGIQRAKALGTKFGRRNSLDASQRRKVAQLHAKGATIRELADQYEVGLATVSRALHGP